MDQQIGKKATGLPVLYPYSILTPRSLVMQATVNGPVFQDPVTMFWVLTDTLNLGYAPSPAIIAPVASVPSSHRSFFSAVLQGNRIRVSLPADIGVGTTRISLYRPDGRRIFLHERADGPLTMTIPLAGRILSKGFQVLVVEKAGVKFHAPLVLMHTKGNY